MSEMKISLDQILFLPSMPKDNNNFFQIKITEGQYNLDAQLELFDKSDSLIIAFHGNTSQKINPYPLFQKKNIAKRLRSNILSIADPTIQKDKLMNLGWYLGFKDFPAQKIIVSFLKSIIQSYDFRKVIFMGGSGGGFASLFFSWHFPSSVALINNPQTILKGNLLSRQNKIEHVIKNNFGGEFEQLCLDVCNLYRSGFDNKVVYLQNGECSDDLKLHAIPFFKDCMSSNPNNIVVKIDYWGIKGHSGSVPFTESLKWVNAINAIDGELTSSAIYQKYFDQEHQKSTRPESIENLQNSSRLLEISEMLGLAKY